MPNSRDDDNKPAKAIRAEAQAYSDAIMKVREVALELKAAAVACSHARIVLQTKMMTDPGAKIMGMDSGSIEVDEFKIMGTYGLARSMHEKARELGRKYNEPMPANPEYDPEYEALYSEEVSFRLSAPARR
jgi:hypothetical protein